VERAGYQRTSWAWHWEAPPDVVAVEVCPICRLKLDVTRTVDLASGTPSHWECTARAAIEYADTLAVGSELHTEIDWPTIRYFAHMIPRALKMRSLELLSIRTDGTSAVAWVVVSSEAMKGWPKVK
jgi:hypothetical protein